MQVTQAPSTTSSALPDIAPGVYGLRTVMVNLFAVADQEGSWTLIDAGLYFSATRIRSWTEHLFGEGSRPSSILLTHGHFDHVGSLRELAEGWDVPVYAHALEMPYLTGLSKYPPPDPSVGGGVLAWLSGMYPRRPINLGKRVRTLPEGGTVPGLDGWRWIHTPGHTAGHVSFFRDEDRVLIAGDAFVTTKQESFISVLTQRREFHGPPAYYTSDWEAAQLSVGRLADLQPSVVVTGHGLPVSGVAAFNGLNSLADDFVFRGMPARGRYVREPAVTNESGIVSLPPATSKPYTNLLVATAVAGAVWFAMSRRSSRGQ